MSNRKNNQKTEVNKPFLNEKQAEAARHPRGPLLIAAGAGSGKTRTLTNRLFYLLESGVKPENIIAITFTNKAADEMKSRVAVLIHNSKFIIQNSLFVGTFHSLGARILKKNGRLVGRGSNFTIFDGDDSARLIKNIIKNLNLSEKRSPAILQHQFSHIKNELLEPENSGFEEVVAALFREYEVELRKNNAFDFDDLIEKPVRIFMEYPEVLQKYQSQFRHILVDEFQDVNTSQYAFVKTLAEKYHNLSVVGDDQQSIYKFRGSDFRNFLNFERDWPGAKIVLLEENYRSRGNIIAAASAVIKNNKFQKPKDLWTKNDEGELIKVTEHDDAVAEAEFVADKVKESMGYAGVIINEFKNKTYQPINLSTAVLYRTNAQSRAVEQALIERGINYRIFGGVKFYERKEIKDIIAGLRYALNPKDRISLERLEKNYLKKPYLIMKDNLPMKVKELSPVEVIDYILKTADYFHYLEKTFTNWGERIENVHELVDFASTFSNLGDFLEKVSLMQQTDKPTATHDKQLTTDNKGSSVVGHQLLVNLMTIHLAKGLEFDSVFIIGCNEGVIPHQMSYKSIDEIEEERRLMYVAMTRAKEKLYINFYDLPSRFLYEIPPELTEFSGNRILDDEERYITIS